MLPTPIARSGEEDASGQGDASLLLPIQATSIDLSQPTFLRDLQNGSDLLHIVHLHAFQ